MSYNLPQRQLVNQQNASIIEAARVPRSTFIGRKTRLMTFDQGELVPFYIDECLPGDHMKFKVHAYVRMATPLFPLFSNLRVETFWFFCPARVLWENWEKFMGAQANPTDSINYTIPRINLDNNHLGVNTIYDHMGLPAEFAAGASIDVNALPLRMYNLVWNEWFRDQNVDQSKIIRKGDTGDIPSDYQLGRRRKSHNYFTAALPFTQKFSTPYMPLTGFANVLGIGIQGGASGPLAQNWLETGGGTPVYANPTAVTLTGGGSGRDIAIDLNAGVPNIRADMSTATGVAINALRTAFMVQTLLERDARGGTRYTELIRSHFGVINPDYRLQRPEYIGGGSTPMVITPVAQTAPTTGATVGALGGAGTAAGQHTADYAATEHGYILALINVQSEQGYQQGLHKLWQRLTRLDFYFPALAQLGEQAITTNEIYSTGDGTADAVVFGYQARWEEYRQIWSDCTGYMRSTYTGALDAWHLVQRFTSAPTLSGAFLKDEAPMSRVLAAGTNADDQQFLAEILVERTAVRPLPTFGTPATLGRF